MFTFTRSIRLVLFCCFLSTALISPSARAGYDDWQLQPNGGNNGIVVNRNNIMLIYISPVIGNQIFAYLNMIYNNYNWYGNFVPPAPPPQFHLSMLYQEDYQHPPIPVQPPISAQIVDRSNTILTVGTANAPQVFINEFASPEDIHITMGRDINNGNPYRTFPVYYYYPCCQGTPYNIGGCWEYKDALGNPALYFDRYNFIQYMNGEDAIAYNYNGEPIYNNPVRIQHTQDTNELSDRFYAVLMLTDAWEDATSPPVPVPTPPSH